MSTKNKTNLSHHNESVKTLENTLEKVMLGGGEAKLKKEARKRQTFCQRTHCLFIG